jgi:hypothetical protein
MMGSASRGRLVAVAASALVESIHARKAISAIGVAAGVK